MSEAEQKAEKKKVLIVEDEKNVREMLAMIVEEMGYECVAVERARRGHQVLSETRVDAILLDLRMPGPRGDQFLQFLKKQNVEIPPTIVVSGALDKQVIGNLVRLGVSGVISKPFEIRRLMQELRRVLEGREGGRFVYCSQCGVLTALEDRFCRSCGNNLERERACPECETTNGPGDRFCRNCGEGLREDLDQETLFAGE